MQDKKVQDRKVQGGKMWEKNVNGLFGFIDSSPCSFWAVENLRAMLAEAGYEELDERSEWELTPGKGYLVVRNGSSIVAFYIPKEVRHTRFRIVSSHCDSPSFKVKENPEMVSEGVYIRLNTEKYGGMIHSTWLDRSLSVAGRIVVQTENGLVGRLVNIDEDLLVIPNVAIHMNRDMNKGIEYNPQVDLLPLFGEAEEGEDEKGSLLELIGRREGIDPACILGHDLFLYVREPGRRIGRRGEYLLSPRLDDLQCAYTSMRTMLEARPEDHINMCLVLDNEEVGSGSRQGADSTFLEDVLGRLRQAFGWSEGKLQSMIADSFMISADNAHAVHPNHPEKSDPTNRPVINGGIVIKYHGGLKYTTDGWSAAGVKALCREAEVPVQTYANRSDVAGGSTLGNILLAHVSIPSADIGLPQLAMHSAVETAGAKDTEYAMRFFERFWR